MFAEVAVPLHLRQTFTYRVPQELIGRAKPGCRALVQLGSKTLAGFIVALHEDLNGQVISSEIKELKGLIDEGPLIPEQILELTRWMADYYYAPWGECIRAALPVAAISAEEIFGITEAGRAALADSESLAGLAPVERKLLEALAEADQMKLSDLKEHSPSGTASAIGKLERLGLIRARRQIEDKLKPKFQRCVRLAVGPAQSAGKLSERQRRVIATLGAAQDGLTMSELLRATGVSISVVRRLIERGLIETFSRQVRRSPFSRLPKSTAPQIKLTSQQQSILDQITAEMAKGKYATFLLHGVTGSGKTEIYIRAMRECLEVGKTALMLVPEIALTPMFSLRLRSHFGEAVAILHSGLSEGERADEWRQVKSGQAKIVIGTRSAVFAPLENLGLVVVDEEHEPSYKQEEAPRYHGRDTAIVRAARAGAVVILGSATPSLESFHNARVGKYIYMRLDRRYGDRPLAQVEAVDMREVFNRHGKRQIFSDELKEALAETCARREQALILLNRRGFSSFLLCRSCGLTMRCPNCEVSLTYHRYNSSLQCHYCNYIRPVPAKCPSCGGIYIHYVGEGTEQIEARLKALFPEMKIARLDRDTTRRRGSYEQILMEFASGGIDLLVGTQMIAKGHDFHNVTLVGVISVDVGLSLPDFRSAERTFQLLTQVAGRAGRGDRPGRVIVQTYHPEHYAIASALRQDYEEFYSREISFRRSMHYPPFVALTSICAHHRDRQWAIGAAHHIAQQLRALSDSNLRILGPAPAPLSKLKGEYRFQVLIKSRNRNRARQALAVAIEKAIASGYNTRHISIEVDPISLM
jgi:primosomal protein N' (replication factor Y)